MSKTTFAVLLIAGAIVAHCYISDNSYKKGYTEGYDNGHFEASEKYEIQIDAVSEDSYEDGYADGFRYARDNPDAVLFRTKAGDVIVPNEEKE